MGKTEVCHAKRDEIEAEIVHCAQKYEPNFKSIDQVLRNWSGYMDSDDFEFLSEHQESAHPMHAPQDYSIKVSERVLHLERANFFIGSRDNDWHLPLLVTMREEATKNWRQRSASGWKHIAEKKEKFAEKGQEMRNGERKGTRERQGAVSRK